VLRIGRGASGGVQQPLGALQAAQWFHSTEVALHFEYRLGAMEFFFLSLGSGLGWDGKG
jgi:hypothetical protein